MTIIPEQRRANKRPGNTSVQLWHKRVSVFFESLLLVAALILAGASAATSTLASTNNLTSSAFDLRFPNCNGDTPGFCPDGPFMNI